MNINPFAPGGPGSNLNTQVARLRVMEGELSQVQRAGVIRAFEQHKATLKQSLAGFVVLQYQLTDGTRIRIQSNSGIHDLMVWPAPSGQGEKLPHGFAVVTLTGAPVIYGRYSTDEGETWAWKVYGELVPQAVKEIAGYNQVLRAPATVLPIVANPTAARSWDWWVHSGYAGAVGAGDWLVPINTVIEGADFKPHQVHYAFNDSVRKADETALYTVAASDFILLDESDEQEAWPPSSDSAGNFIALAHWRVAIISVGSNIWQFRICTEMVKRTAAETYEQVSGSREITDIITPLDEDTVNVGATGTTLGETPPTSSLFLNNSSVSSSSSYGDFSVQNGFQWNPVSVAGSITETETATNQTAADTLDASATGRIAALGGTDAIDGLDLRTELNYPDTMQWRAGTITASYSRATVLPVPRDYYGIYSKSLTRMDMNWTLDNSGQPARAWIPLGWDLSAGNDEFDIFEGLVDGVQSGRLHIDTEIRTGNSNFIETASTYVIFGSVVGLPRADALALASSTDQKASLAALVDNYSTPGVSDDRTIIAQPHNDRPVNTGEYQFTSRHVIDYDHRGRFIAWIRVTVACTGAAWEEDTGVHNGFMQVADDPNYTITVAFESNWNGVAGSTVLLTATGTKPAFEFDLTTKLNPYYWPPSLADISAGRDEFYVRMPPRVTPAEDSMQMLINLARHQGVSPAMACQDIREDFTEDEETALNSLRGIEFYELRDNREIAHQKRVTGQLYAKKINLLADYPEALWLLSRLTIDAKEDDGATGPAYFYFSGLEDDLNDDYTVAVRDGVHVNWPADMPTSGDAASWAGADQPTRVYQV